MKQTKFLMALFLGIMMIGSVMALDDDATLPPYSSVDGYYSVADGGPLYDQIRANVGLTDKIRLASSTGGGLTMIDGALCSTWPDREVSYTPSGPSIERYCYTNTLHQGVAWQLFETDASGWDFLGEKKITQGDRQCFNVEYQKDYVAHWFYCDEMEKVCTNFESTSSCQDPANGGPFTVRERSCTENGQTTNEKVVTDYWDPDAPQTCDTSGSGGGSGTGSGGGNDAGGGSSGGDDPEAGQTYTCLGTWDSVAFPTNVRPGAEYDGIGKFTPSASGKCILTAHMGADAKESLAVVNAEGSACGQPDPYYAEVWVDAVSGETIDVNFKNMKARSTPGVYDVYVGAWNGCFKDGGSESAFSTQPVAVNTLIGDANVSLAYVGGAGGFIVALAVLLFIGAFIWWAKKT